ncbi:MAG: hypothetical protein HYY20_03490 [Candidatus Tectomicrobia bacterium]|uniref:Flagellar assembly protein T C-terminal domain-containing protein n=1 Tax=Tectimicrobiota bacterium TaxID=2528274 RepID=A0A932FVZ0_UNCTE|nr:hypothetical protein [Candidatus Tectomicrobia bacterium]
MTTLTIAWMLSFASTVSYAAPPASSPIGHRLSLLVYPLEDKADNPALADKVTSQLVQALVHQGRFRVLTGKRRRIDLLQEQKYSHHQIIEEATRAELGRLAAAELILEGTIYATKGSIGIDTQIINLETSEIVAKEVIKGKEPDEKMLERLAQKLSQYFPLLEGLVVGKEGYTLLIETGQRSAIKPGMKLILYREGKEIRHPTTGTILGKRSEIIGGARIERIAGGLIEAKVTETEPGKDTKIGDKFITK